jgi:hypothetical protein
MVGLDILWFKSLIKIADPNHLNSADLTTAEFCKLPDFLYSMKYWLNLIQWFNLGFLIIKYEAKIYKCFKKR